MPLFGFKVGETVLYKGYRCRITAIYGNGGVNLLYLDRYKGLHSYIKGITTPHGFYGIDPDIKKTLGNVLKKI